WRFTSVAPIARIPFRPAEPAAEGVTAEQLQRIWFDGPEACRLVLLNGRYAPELSSVPHGLKAGSLAEALREEPESVEPYLARYASYENHAFVALNTAFLEDGAFVRIPKGVVLEGPIQLVFVSSGGMEPTVSHPRNLILAGANSQATIVESYLGLGDQV